MSYEQEIFKNICGFFLSTVGTGVDETADKLYELSDMVIDGADDFRNIDIANVEAVVNDKDIANLIIRAATFISEHGLTDSLGYMRRKRRYVWTSCMSRAIMMALVDSLRTLLAEECTEEHRIARGVWILAKFNDINKYCSCAPHKGGMCHSAVKDIMRLHIIIPESIMCAYETKHGKLII